jgi:hypothetical protein
MTEAEVLAEGELLFRFTARPEEKVTCYGALVDEYIVIGNPQAAAGLVVYVRLKIDGGSWEANPWSERLVIRRLLEELGKRH